MLVFLSKLLLGLCFSQLLLASFWPGLLWPPSGPTRARAEFLRCVSPQRFARMPLGGDLRQALQGLRAEGDGAHGAHGGCQGKPEGRQTKKQTSPKAKKCPPKNRIPEKKKKNSPKTRGSPKIGSPKKKTNNNSHNKKKNKTTHLGGPQSEPSRPPMSVLWAGCIGVFFSSGPISRLREKRAARRRRTLDIAPARWFPMPLIWDSGGLSFDRRR